MNDPDRNGTPARGRGRERRTARLPVMAAMLAASVGLLALGGLADAAEPDKKSKEPGEWLYDGKEDQPCAIFQQGRALLLVSGSKTRFLTVSTWPGAASVTTARPASVSVARV